MSSTGVTCDPNTKRHTGGPCEALAVEVASTPRVAEEVKVQVDLALGAGTKQQNHGGAQKLGHGFAVLVTKASPDVGLARAEGPSRRVKGGRLGIVDG